MPKEFPLRQTSTNSGHKHFYRDNNIFTTYNSGHHHKVNIKKKLAMPAGKDLHPHKLLRKLKGSRNKY